MIESHCLSFIVFYYNIIEKNNTDFRNYVVGLD